MRCSNLIDLKINEVDLYNNLLHLRTTKNRKPLAIPITNALQPILREYLSVRNGSDENYMFSTAYGDKANRDSIDSSMRRYNYNRGVNKTGIHRWRHTFAKQWILNGGDIIKLQKTLNHSDLDMVRNYVNIFTKDLQDGFEDFNPLEFINKKSIKMKDKK